ncbi:MAG: hypothetical protein D6705_08825 [Deltaproteobacteria bacterium]|nr:MAG: hypothetical protein D6705_08825 [Deltaproteobacteria bacterium]
MQLTSPGSMHARRRIGAALLAATVLAWPRPAWTASPEDAAAEPSREAPADTETEGGDDDPRRREARALFEAGAKAYALGHYGEAVEKFEASYDLYPAPELLFNLGQAYARWHEVEPDLAKLRKARSLFRNYVSFVRARDYGDSQAASDALAEIEKIDAELAKAEVADARGPKDDRRRRKIALGVGLGLGAAALVAGAVVLGVLLGRRSAEPEPELGTIPIGGAGPRGPVLFRF